MSIVRSVFFLALGVLAISSMCIMIQNHLTVESVNDKENLQPSRHHVLSLGQEDDDVLVFVHVRISVFGFHVLFLIAHFFFYLVFHCQQSS